MSKNAKDKEKPLERFKSLFGLGKASLPAVPRLEEHAIDLEVLKELGKDCPVAQRLKVIKDLTEVVRTRRLAQGGAESLYSLTCDLLHPAHGTEVRHAVLNFYCTLVRAQRDPLDIIRAHCFNLVLDLSLPEDLPLRLELVRALTDNGKCLNLFEEQAGTFLVKWMPEVLSAGRAQELLPLLVNVVRFNSSFLDRTTIMGFVQNTCILCCRTNLELDVQLGLELLDSVVGYGMVSADLLGHLVPTACRTVVVAPFSEPSWRLMRNLLGTHLGHRTIGYLCRLLEDRSNVCDTTLLKGAVFFVGAALWSPKAVGSLQHTAAGVLPSLGRALESGNAHPSVAYEAAVCLQWLLGEGAPPLGPVAWDAILNLLSTLLTFPQGQPSGRQLQQMAHELLTRVELSYDQGTFEGSATHLFELVDQAAQLRPETSLLRLVEFRTRQAELCPLRWASQMAELLERFLDPVMATPAVQLRLLDLLASHRHLCQADELVEKVLLPHVSPLETDPAVAARAVRLLADVLLRDDLSSQHTADLLDLLRKVLMRGWRPEELLALEAAVEGLCHLFQAHVCDGQPTVAVSVLQLLSQHLHQQCRDGSPPAELAPLRLQLVQTLVALRTSPLYQVGLCDTATGQVTFSRQLTCTFREGSPCASSGSSASVQQLCFREPLDALLCCLREETDGSVLSTLLRGLPGLLRDRAVVLCGQLSLRRLSSWLISHVADRKLLDKVRTAGGEALLYPVASALVLYRAELDAQSPLLLLHVLESGLGCKPAAALCLRALALAALELRPATAKILPELLQRLAQLSPTVAVSLPVLEFLACLIRVPQLYASFVAAEYRKVFAIALPYTNPARFSEVVVALAHHLVALWFLKCRVEFRKDLAPFIMKNLRAQLELGEEERRDPTVVKLQEELLATLGDLVAQCSFGSCGAQPRRSGAAMFLLEQGRAQSWLLPGHRLVTITTSGCAGRPARLSLCDRCALFCQEPALMHGAEMSMQQQHQQNPLQQQQQQRRRHQSEAAGRASGLRHPPATQDDLSLERRGAGGRAGLVLRHVCGCWCCGWAEVLVRRPTGNSAWLLRLQNDLFPRAATSTDFPLPDVAAIFRCHLVDTNDEAVSHAASVSERSPLRRTNSSPEVPAQDLPRCERHRYQLLWSYDSIPEESQPLRPPADWDSRSHSARRSLEGWSQAAVPPASCYRDRGHTVSGASPASDSGATATTAYVDLYRSGMNPRFVFLHLFRSLGQAERALPLPESDVERSVGVFDHILTYETHRMGLLYVGPGQSGQEQCILSNTHGSVRYTMLLRGLGSLVRLSELDPRRTYLGGLACTGEDGSHCLCWQDDVTQVVFHVATLMPNVENDRHRGNKKRHIGNDYVHIVYNESSEPYDLATIRGDCHCVCVVVEPLKLGHNLVSLVGKPEVLELLRPPPEPQLVPDSSLAVYVRQTAIHANVACTNFHRSKAGSSYVNNWHERLQHLERLRLRLVERSSEPQPDDLADL
ncbi:tuberin-like isoform X3 [Dermacentor silvarum]|uniref:tuberin-like isoform X3 n=1 Tax=Dermacentor silvarum TaxID=543639 RepID=UPI002100B02C|nr:tuberin-like isoform X3 [Dermacentor silvarum]